MIDPTCVLVKSSIDRNNVSRTWATMHNFKIKYEYSVNTVPDIFQIENQQGINKVRVTNKFNNHFTSINSEYVDKNQL